MGLVEFNSTGRLLEQQQLGFFFFFFLLFCFALDLQQHFYSFLLHITPMVSRMKLHSHLTRILASCHHTDFLKKIFHEDTLCRLDLNQNET